MASSSALALPLVPAAAAWAVVVELAAPLVLEPPLEGRNTSERNTVHACMQLVSCNALDVRASAADELVRRRAQPHTQAKHGWALSRGGRSRVRLSRHGSQLSNSRHIAAASASVAIMRASGVLLKRKDLHVAKDA